MRCREVESHLEDWLKGQASPEFVAHLGTCARCRNLAEQLHRSVPLLADLRQPPPQLDPGFWIRLREKIESAGERQEAFWTAFNLLARQAAAVLAALLLVLGLLTLRRPPPESITGVELAQEGNGLPAEEITSDQVLISLAETEPRQ